MTFLLNSFHCSSLSSFLPQDGFTNLFLQIRKLRLHSSRFVTDRSLAPSSFLLALPQPLFLLFPLAAEISSGQGVPAKACGAGGISGGGEDDTLKDASPPGSPDSSEDGSLIHLHLTLLWQACQRGEEVMGFRGMFWCIAMQTLAAEVSHEEMGGQWFCSLVLRILRVFDLGDQQPVFPFCPSDTP